jgi:hypothetical protein
MPGISKMPGISSRSGKLQKSAVRSPEPLPPLAEIPQFVIPQFIIPHFIDDARLFVLEPPL